MYCWPGRTLLIILLWIIGFILGQTPSVAQEIRPIWFRGLHGTLKSGFEGEWDRYTSQGGKETSTQSIYRTQGLDTMNEGYVYHPRFMTFSLGGDLGLFQDRLSGEEGAVSGKGDLNGYHLRTTFLGEHPYTLTLLGNRGRSTTRRGFGERSIYENTNYEGIFSLKKIAFPSRFSYRVEHPTEEYSGGGGFRGGAGAATRSESRTRIYSYEGSRQKERSYTSLRLAHTDFDDLLNPSDFRTNEGDFSYTLTFGKEANKRWDSDLRYDGRRGQTQYDFYGLNEGLFIRHSKSLSTHYRYGFSDIRVQGGETLSHNGSLGLSHQLYQSLSSSLGLSGSLSRFPGGEDKRYRGDINFDYRKRIPWGGSFLAGWGSSYEVQDQTAGGGLIFVFHERHQFEDGVPIFLDNPKVDLTTLVLYDQAGKIIYEEERDYTVRVRGAGVVAIYRNSFGRIREGETVLIDYQYSAPPQLKYSTMNQRWNVGMDYQWFSLYHREERQGQTLLKGREEGLLEDIESRTTGGQLRFSWRWGGGSLSADYRDYDSSRSAYKSWNLNQSLSLGLGRNINLSLNGSQSFFKEEGGRGIVLEEGVFPGLGPEGVRGKLWQGNRLRAFSGGASLGWRPLSNLSLSFYGRIRRTEEDLGIDQRFIDLGAEGGLSLGRVSLRFSLEHNQQNDEIGTRRGEDRVMLYMVRSFGR